jgi:hypothetical protein
MDDTRLKLPDVTLIAIDTVCHQLAKMAVEDSLRHCDFADVLIFSDQHIDVPGAHWCEIDSFRAMDGYTDTLWLEAWKQVKTSHFLVVQWDSWVVNPSLWTNEVTPVV